MRAWHLSCVAFVQWFSTALNIRDMSRRTQLDPMGAGRYGAKSFSAAWQGVGSAGTPRSRCRTVVDRRRVCARDTISCHCAARRRRPDAEAVGVDLSGSRGYGSPAARDARPTQLNTGPAPAARSPWHNSRPATSAGWWPDPTFSTVRLPAGQTPRTDAFPRPAAPRTPSRSGPGPHARVSAPPSRRGALRCRRRG